MGKLNLTWHGHSCFTLEEDGYSIVLDPYSDGSVPGFGNLRLTADEVLCSHGHGDHNAVQCVKINKDASSKKNPFAITEIHSYHDDAKGKKRGNNIIRIFDDGEYRIAHMGDIGCPPTEDQKEVLKNIDIMLMPVGGFFTLEPAEVRKLVQELNPHMLITMHYRGAEFGYDVIAPVENYLSMCDKSSVFCLEKSSITIPEDLKSGTVVLTAPTE